MTAENELFLPPSIRGIVFLDDQKVHLTSREFRILSLLYENPLVPVSKSSLIRYTWGLDTVDFNSDANLRVQVCRLRTKLDISDFYVGILPERRYGYLLNNTFRNLKIVYKGLTSPADELLLP